MNETKANGGTAADMWVRDAAAAAAGPCDLGVPGVCVADDRGPVEVYRLDADERRIAVCRGCAERMALADPRATHP